MSAAGIHIRVAPEGFRTCTLVVTSNVRQAPGAVPCTNSRPAFGNAIAADTAPAERKKSRRFMAHLFDQNFLFEFLANQKFTPDSARMQSGRLVSPSRATEPFSVDGSPTLRSKNGVLESLDRPHHMPG
jgi:hypothetical protein